MKRGPCDFTEHLRGEELLRLQRDGCLEGRSSIRMGHRGINTAARARSCRPRWCSPTSTAPHTKLAPVCNSQKLWLRSNNDGNERCGGSRSASSAGASRRRRDASRRWSGAARRRRSVGGPRRRRGEPTASRYRSMLGNRPRHSELFVAADAEMSV